MSIKGRRSKPPEYDDQIKRDRDKCGLSGCERPVGRREAREVRILVRLDEISIKGEPHGALELT